MDRLKSADFLLRYLIQENKFKLMKVVDQGIFLLTFLFVISLTPTISCSIDTIPSTWSNNFTNVTNNTAINAGTGENR